MMVLSAIMLLSMIILEFVYSSNVNYQIANNEKERLQAYYLAQSALNLMKIEMKIDKQVKSAIASSPIASQINIDLSQPMCQQFPFSTGLLRAFFIGGVIPSGEGGGNEEGAKEEGGEGKGKSVTFMDSEKAQEFLAFDGDFEGSCTPEEGKFNLNYFAALDPAQQTLSGSSQYDTYKKILTGVLKNEKYKKLFDKPEAIDSIVQNIADWVDKNDQINELGNVTKGLETSVYKETGRQQPRNSKMLSLAEAYLVEGVDDKWFLPLEDMFTIYGDSKINVCQADDEVVWALILAYASQNPNAVPINPKNPDAKKNLLDVVKDSCAGAQPQASKIAQDLDTALGITGGGGSFASLITTESRFYSLKLTGQVGDTVVNIKTVLDIKDTDPKKWKLLYYKVY